MSRLTDAIGLERLGRIGARVRQMPGGPRAINAADRIRSRWIERSGSAAETAKSRWREVSPGPLLTWGMELPGDAFVEAAERHGAFGPDRSVLEIGPGYGRLLASALERGEEFGRWLALDISPEVVRHMDERFDDPRVEARVGDAEAAQLGEAFTTVLSSLTFKHLYPDFGAALRNLRSALGPDAVVLFDLIEGDRRWVQYDGATYVRAYGHQEVESLLTESGYELAAFDEVFHSPEHPRLLVAARPRG